MLPNNKKFEAEINALPELLRGDVLSADRQAAIKDKVLLAIKNPPAAPFPAVFWKVRYHKAVRYGVTILLGLSLVGGTSFAASGSTLPGDFLYPVKLAKEKVQLGLTVGQESKAKLKAKFAENRLSELHALTTTTDKETGVSAEAGSVAQSSNKTNTASGTLPSSSDEKHGVSGNIKLKAQLEARTEVNDALGELNKLNVKFKAQGNSRGAAGISAAILKLQDQAQSENLDLGGQQGYNSAPKDNRRGQGLRQATDTPESQLKVNVNPGDGGPEHTGGASGSLQIKVNDGTNDN